MSGALKVGGTFLVVLVLVLGVAAGAGVALDDDPRTEPEIQNPQYEDDDLLLDVSPGEATVQMDSNAENTTVLIDASSSGAVSPGIGAPPGAGFAPSIRERSMLPLTNALTAAGHNVTLLSGTDDLESQLEDADGFVSFSLSDYNEEDLDALAEFTENDGRVLFATDPGDTYSSDFSATVLRSEFGLTVDSGYVFNTEENDLNYQRIFAETGQGSSVTEGVDRAVFPTATAVGSQEPDGTLQAISGSVDSTTRTETSAPILVHEGNMVFVGTTDFMTPENTQRADNDVLVGNIADFLVSGDAELDTGNGDEDETDGNQQVETMIVGPEGEPVFEPEFLEVEPGTTVQFEWDSDGHNIELTEQPPNSDWEGVPQAQNEGFVHNHTFEAEGIYEFVSGPSEDEGMRGAVVVGEPTTGGS